MKLILVLVIFLTANHLFSQIVIDSADILTDIGTSWTTLSYDDPINVVLGDSGGAHTWDFTSLASQLNDTFLYYLINPQTAPLHDSFPDANLVKMSTDLYSTDSSYDYIEITDSYYRLLGFQQNIYGITGIVKLDSSTMYFPFTYGSSSSIYAFDTVINSPDTFVTVELTRDMSIDAYGTVIIPSGSFPCLRIRSHTVIHLSGYIVIVIPIPFDTTISEYSYNWVTEGQPDLITITSPLNETNPNFTEAGKVEMFRDYLSGIQETPVELNSEQINLVQENNCYYLNFNNLSPGYLKIYDLSGREINHNRIGGTGRISLELDQSGIYFISFKNYNINIISKINFLKYI
jgi:hypothetical protein